MDYQRRLHLPYPVLADPDGGAYECFQVGRWALRLLRQSAVFVIDRQGRIVYAQVVNNPKAALKLEKVKGMLQATTGGLFGGK